MKNSTSKIILGSAIFGLALTAGAMSSLAFNGNYNNGQDKQGFGPQRESAIKQEVKEAVQNQDYNTWRELIGDRPVTEQINEGNFARFTEMMQLMQSGDRESAEAIREELGLPKRQGPGKGQGRRGFPERRGGFQDTNGDGICDNLDLENQNQ